MAERLTARDIENQEFPNRLKGFDRDEVKMYLKSVGEEVERLNLENAERAEELGQLRARVEEFSQRERILQDAIVSAQRMSDEIQHKARSEADLLLREARIKTERTLQESQDQLSRIENEIGRLRLERGSFEKRLRGLVEQHLELLDLRSSERREREDINPMHVLQPASGYEAG